MRELTDEARVDRGSVRGRALLRDHGGGFSPATAVRDLLSSLLVTGRVLD